MPSTGASWPAAIWMPEAVMKPEMTGWLRKFARNPSRSSPMATSSSPEIMASAMAAPRYSGVPWDASCADGGRGHQAGHRHRADRQRARGAEDRIEHQRRHRGIEPDLRRQPGQQRIGQRLRDQHDRDDHRHDQVVGERLARCIAPPSPGSGDSGAVCSARRPLPFCFLLCLLISWCTLLTG